jgi:hypothetical protein
MGTESIHPTDVIPLTVEQQIRWTRMCLFEIGLHDIEILQIGTRSDGVPVIGTSDAISPAVGYQVGLLLATKTSTAICCWSCFMEEYETAEFGAAEDCRAGRCRHPEGPARPPREMLLAT